MDNYKPFLGCNEPFVVEALRYPLVATIKKDGIRGIVRQGNLRSRSSMTQELPLIKNRQIQELARPLKELTQTYKYLTIDMEIYIHGIPFNELAMFVNTEDINNRTHYNKIKKIVSTLSKPFHYYTKIPNELEFYIFNTVTKGEEYIGYLDRLEKLKPLLSIERVKIVTVMKIENSYDLLNYYESVISDGFEGLVLSKEDSPYKYGRSTLKEEHFLKMKPSENYEGIIIELHERMLNFSPSEKSFAGYSIKKTDKDNKEGSGIAATVSIEWNGEILKATLGGTEVERIKMWENKESYVGKKVIFTGMPYGMKRVPRFPRIIKIT